MADVIGNANRESQLFASLQKAVTTDLYSYHLDSNAPNSSKSVVTISPQTNPSGTIAGATMLFRIPAYGLVERMLIESSLTSNVTETTATLHTNLGYRVFSDIRLQAHGKVIVSGDHNFITARCETAPKEKGDAYVSVANYVGVYFSSAVATTVYTPVPFFFDGAPHMALDTSFVEECELQCTVNSLVGMGVSALTAGTFKLHIYYRQLVGEYNDSYRQKNFSMTSPLNMLITDSYTETQRLVSADTTTTFTLKCPNLAHCTHFFFTQATNIGMRSIPVSAISFKASGRDILATLPSQVLWYDSGFMNVGNVFRTAVGTHAVRSEGTRVLTIWWGEHGNDRKSNSGSAAYSNLNNVQLVLTHTAAGDSTTDLVAVTEYFKILSVAPNDGRMDVGYSL